MRMILVMLAGLLVACGQPDRAQSSADRNLHYAVKIGEQYGAIDQRGELVLPPVTAARCKKPATRGCRPEASSAACPSPPSPDFMM